MRFIVNDREDLKWGFAYGRTHHTHGTVIITTHNDKVRINAPVNEVLNAPDAKSVELIPEHAKEMKVTILSKD